MEEKKLSFQKHFQNNQIEKKNQFVLLKDINMQKAKYDYDFIDLDDIDISGFEYSEFFEIETLSEDEIASLVDDNFIEF